MAATSTSETTGSDAANLQLPGRKINVHYLRRDGNYDGWGLHVWGDAKVETTWADPLKPTEDGGKLKWTVELIPEQTRNNFNHWVGFQVHKGDEKDCGGRLIEVKDDDDNLYFVSGSLDVFTQEPKLSELPVGNLRKASAHWVEGNTLLWRIGATGGDTSPRKFQLAWSKNAALKLTGEGLQGADGFLDVAPKPGFEAGKIPLEVQRRFPHLEGCTTFELPPVENLQDLLTAQLAVAAFEADGTPVDVTGVQLQGVLDDLFFYSGPLGTNLKAEGIDVALWAPTAQEVTLQLWEGPRGGTAECVPMSREGGVWSSTVPRSWLWRYYTYKIKVYNVWTQQVQVFEATDPYSLSLAADGARTQIADLEDASLKPPGWDGEVPPENLNFRHPADMSVYELHIRDFSMYDPKVPPPLRGKYAAFAADGLGAAHLRDLQAAGLTHVHLLPAYDYGSVPERPEDQQQPEGDLTRFPPDSEAQQAAVLAVADTDAFNWGYDPVHYSVPEGSYATNPDGPSRILEFRGMVQALHSMGLRVILDVVYNHTFHSGMDGPDSKYAVFDKIVPGYYHRRTEAGDLCTSACCNNTAPEHLMFERLIVEDIVHWAKTYKVDGFRWDIMGHLMLRNMEAVQKALSQLTLEADGVDGGRILHYGEAWSFGEVAFNQRGRNASQANIGGTGIGSFNDRLRDAVMGGSPFASPQHQGWATGMGTQPSSFTQAEISPEKQRELLLEAGDLVKLSLSGLLKNYELETGAGEIKKGRQIFYGPQPAAYCEQPAENVNYTSCHDGETLFDLVMEKAAAEVGLEQRLRMHTLALAVVALGQGVAFFHAGCDILRSKSLDRDSYNSGDWFNRLDWTLQSNNFGIGLPVATKNKNYWHLKQPLLADDSLRPSPAQIQAAKQRFLELLRLRYSTPLLRLQSFDDISAQLKFHNTGPNQAAGVVVMEIGSADTLGKGSTQDPNFCRLFVVANARPDSFTFSWPEGAKNLQLHEVQQNSVDAILRQAAADSSSRTVTVPGRTAAVFVEPRSS